MTERICFFKVCDIYLSENPPIPLGFEVIDFRPTTKDDAYLGTDGTVWRSTITGTPRLILRPVKPVATLKFTPKLRTRHVKEQEYFRCDNERVIHFAKDSVLFGRPVTIYTLEEVPA